MGTASVRLGFFRQSGFRPQQRRCIMIASSFAIVAGLFVVAALGSYMLLNRTHHDHKVTPRGPHRHGEPMLK